MSSDKHPTILVLNGPNLNRLGKRQPDVYGVVTLPELEKQLFNAGHARGLQVVCRQSNAEHELVEYVHEAADKQWPVIINPGGLTHTSVVLRDALAEVAERKGFIEVHISNIHAREPFRAHSYLSPIARGVICGLGVSGYYAAVDYWAKNLA